MRADHFLVREVFPLRIYPAKFPHMANTKTVRRACTVTEQTPTDDFEAREAEVLVVIAERETRLEYLRQQIHALDAQLVEAGEAAAEALAAGSTPPKATLQLQAQLRVELTNLHDALPRVDRLIREAKTKLEEIQHEQTRKIYNEAIERERAALAEFENAMTDTLMPALRAYREAAREAYAVGLPAHLESSAMWRRRTRTLVDFIQTQLKGVLPEDFYHPNARDLASASDTMGRVVYGEPRDVASIPEERPVRLDPGVESYQSPVLDVELSAKLGYDVFMDASKVPAEVEP